MKITLSRILVILFFITSNSLKAQDPILLDEIDKQIYVQMTIDRDFTTFGYSKADKSSSKIICFSNLTSEVDGNHHKCPLGSHYTSDEFTISYLGTEGNSIKAEAKVNGEGAIFYLEKKEVTKE